MGTSSGRRTTSIRLIGLVVLLRVGYSTWEARLRIKRVTLIPEVIYHHEGWHTPASSSSSGGSSASPGTGKFPLFDQVTRLLTPSDGRFSLDETSSFQFYVYDNLTTQYTPQKVSECLENYGNRSSNMSKTDFYSVHCDWSSSICSPQNHTQGSHYSDRRLNRNADAVLARLFLNYQGPLRTFNPRRASIFIVPYPASSQKECFRVKHASKLKAALTQHERALLKTLEFWKEAPTRHLFLYSGGLDHSYLSEYIQRSKGSMIAMLGPRRRPGHLVIPYANTHSHYQPNSLPQTLRAGFHNKRYALSAVLSKEISGNGQIRKDFLEKADVWFSQNQIHGLPVKIIEIGSNSSRRLPDESEVMKLYRESIFCPIFRGDSPIQKRFFDVLLSGCIPVVMTYYRTPNSNNYQNATSYFAEGAVTVTDTYPFAKSTFDGRSDLGIEYSSLVVEIPGGCLECIGPTLKNILSRPELLREKQNHLASLSTLFSYGMEGNFLKHPDAVSALLVQAKHYVSTYPNQSMIL
jgi:hypothetical protein